MTETEIPYVIEGEWDDADWRAAAAKGGERSEVEQDLFMQGPRSHPWGLLAYSVEQPDKRVFIFPTKEHADAFAAGVSMPISSTSNETAEISTPAPKRSRG